MHATVHTTGVLPSLEMMLTVHPLLPRSRVSFDNAQADAEVCTGQVQVWTWGEPWGDFSMKVDRSPKSVAGATNIVKIACGAFHNLCLNM